MGNVHIHAPAGKYQARVRRPGCRKYELVGRPTRVYSHALAVLARKFATGRYKRGDLLWVTDNGYYEPHVVAEIVKR